MAREQEMLAAVQEMRAKVVEAEAEVPKAMAEAFRNGNLGVMDYYNMMNVASDTKMRESISGLNAPTTPKDGPDTVSYTHLLAILRSSVNL